MFDVTVNLPSDNRKSDAIALKLNHKSGYAAEVFFPYAIKDAKLELSPPFARKGVQDIF
ncbi:MAG TPA: hypothetical protein PLA85_12365 [Micropepsaceae bacterium]|mgnify:FL=1|nr:hypothetical protein [Micropepsaceae bacterium]